MAPSEKPHITTQALKRLPYYLKQLKQAHQEGIQFLSATSIASALKLNAVQVRKDISAICTTKGKPKAGFIVSELIENIEDYLGYNNTMDAVLIGVGSLGKALLSNREFDKYGLNIVAAFDVDDDLIGRVICNKQVFPLDKLANLCQRLHVSIGIITVPAEFAQSVCDRLVESGIKAIWNFALVKLHVPDQVLIQNENLAASLAKLSLHLREQLN